MKEYKKIFYKNNKIELILAIIVMELSICLDIATAYILQVVMDLATGNCTRGFKEVLELIAVFLVVMVVFWIFSRTIKYRFYQKAITNYKSHVFHKISKKNMDSFLGQKTGQYISVMTNDVAVIEEDYIVNLFDIIEYSSLFIGTVIVMFFYSWQMLVVVFALCVLPIIVTCLCSSPISYQEKKVSKKNEMYLCMVKDMLAGFSVIKSFKAEKEANKRFDKKNIELEQAKFKKNVFVEYLSIISEALGCIAQISVFLFGAYLSVKGTINPGVVIAFVQLMNYILRPIENLPVLFAKRKAAAALIEKAFDYMKDVEYENEKEVIDASCADIELKNVSVRYEKEDVLKDISFKFAKGKNYAVVGTSGSGKSTLMNTLLGQMRNYDGSIKYGNTELKNINRNSIYNLISVIQQNTFVFDDSIKENITMFGNYSENKIKHCIEKAGLSDLVREKGIGYICGENGSNLSGGECQRLAIARCLIKDASVLLVDEATAALDNHTSEKVMQEILKLEGITKIVVTHKLNSDEMRKYDAILVLSDGKLEECGTYEELMEQKNIFYSLMHIKNRQ